MPDFPIEIDDSAFDSFGPLTFGLGLSISSGALEAADTAHPNGGDKDAEAGRLQRTIGDRDACRRLAHELRKRVG